MGSLRPGPNAFMQRELTERQETHEQRLRGNAFYQADYEALTHQHHHRANEQQDQRAHEQHDYRANEQHDYRTSDQHYREDGRVVPGHNDSWCRNNNFTLTPGEERSSARHDVNTDRSSGRYATASLPSTPSHYPSTAPGNRFDSSHNQATHQVKPGEQTSSILNDNGQQLRSGLVPVSAPSHADLFPQSTAALCRGERQTSFTSPFPSNAYESGEASYWVQPPAPAVTRDATATSEVNEVETTTPAKQHGEVKPTLQKTSSAGPNLRFAFGLGRSPKRNDAVKQVTHEPKPTAPGLLHRLMSGRKKNGRPSIAGDDVPLPIPDKAAVLIGSTNRRSDAARPVHETLMDSPSLDGSMTSPTLPDGFTNDKPASEPSLALHPTFKMTEESMQDRPAVPPKDYRATPPAPVSHDQERKPVRSASTESCHTTGSELSDIQSGILKTVDISVTRARGTMSSLGETTTTCTSDRSPSQNMLQKVGAHLIRSPAQILGRKSLSYFDDDAPPTPPSKDTPTATLTGPVSTRVDQQGSPSLNAMRRSNTVDGSKSSRHMGHRRRPVRVASFQASIVDVEELPEDTDVVEGSGGHVEDDRYKAEATAGLILPSTVYQSNRRSRLRSSRHWAEDWLSSARRSSTSRSSMSMNMVDMERSPTMAHGPELPVNDLRHHPALTSRDPRFAHYFGPHFNVNLLEQGNVDEGRVNASSVSRAVTPPRQIEYPPIPRLLSSPSVTDASPTATAVEAKPVPEMIDISPRGSPRIQVVNNDMLVSRLSLDNGRDGSMEEHVTQHNVHEEIATPTRSPFDGMPDFSPQALARLDHRFSQYASGSAAPSPLRPHRPSNNGAGLIIQDGWTSGEQTIPGAARSTLNSGRARVESPRHSVGGFGHGDHLGSTRGHRRSHAEHRNTIVPTIFVSGVNAGDSNAGEAGNVGE